MRLFEQEESCSELALGYTQGALIRRRAVLEFGQEVQAEYASGSGKQGSGKDVRRQKGRGYRAQGFMKQKVQWRRKGQDEWLSR